MALARLKGKIPKEIPFELKRCESCRRAKQGAIVCRVVRAHDGITEPDGGDWAPPEGFVEWLAAWKAGDGKSTIRTPTKKPKRPRPFWLLRRRLYGRLAITFFPRREPFPKTLGRRPVAAVRFRDAVVGSYHSTDDRALLRSAAALAALELEGDLLRDLAFQSG